MIYSEYIASGGIGIINLLYKNQALKFLPPDLITPLDQSYTRQNGLKVFSDNIADSLTNDKDLTDIAMELKSLYADLWAMQYHATPDAVATNKTVVADNGTSAIKNQVAGYDSADMVDDNAINRTNINTTTTTQTDYTKLADIMEQLRKTDLWRTIKLDLNRYMFITIYN